MRANTLMTILFTGLIFSVVGCVSLQKPAPDIQSFSLNVERQTKGSPSYNGLILKIDKFKTEPRYQTKGLVYQQEEGRFTVDYYNRFIVFTDEMITEQVRGWLSLSPKVKDLVDTVSFYDPDEYYYLEGRITELYGDFTDISAAHAVINLELKLYKKALDKKVSLFVSKKFEKLIPMSEPTVSELIKAYNKGLKEILEEFERAI